ncbi:hypothetical protein MTR67_012485 [Solanum verrucosum]|uniref:Uncharacterized protein n=1 Tax=Solanum verrucosum TaxID=315347 RepID=A0AAF0QBE6_SOLVR|nr:hypothetical protein MTR67_012485 [Solanum verrucosum]
MMKRSFSYILILYMRSVCLSLLNIGIVVDDVIDTVWNCERLEDGGLGNLLGELSLAQFQQQYAYIDVFLPPFNSVENWYEMEPAQEFEFQILNLFPPFQFHSLPIYTFLPSAFWRGFLDTTLQRKFPSKERGWRDKKQERKFTRKLYMQQNSIPLARWFESFVAGFELSLEE